MVKNEKNNSNLTLDWAVMLAIGSGVLYLIGWNYWVSYYSYFGIKQSFIDLTFYQVVASSWWLILLFFLIFLVPLFLVSSGNITSIKDVKVNGYGISILGLIFLIPILDFFLVTWLMGTILFVLFIVILYFKPFLENKELDFGNRLSYRPVTKIIIGVALISIATLINQYYAKKVAKDFVRNSTSHTINIQLGRDKLLKNYILIAQMDGKYFICKKPKDGQKPITIIINKSEVKKAVLIPK